MPPPMTHPTAPERGKSAAREEQGGLTPKENTYKKKLRNKDGGVIAGSPSEQNDASSGTLSSNSSLPAAQTLGSYAGMIYDNIRYDAPRRTPPECYDKPFTFMDGYPNVQSEDAEVTIVKDMIRRAEATGLGTEGPKEGEGEPVDVEDMSVLDYSDEVWDRMVAGSCPFVFDEGSAGAGTAGGVGDGVKKGN